MDRRDYEWGLGDFGHVQNPSRLSGIGPRCILCKVNVKKSDQQGQQFILIPLGTDDEARLVEIAENLHREDLTGGQRADQTAEYARITAARQAKTSSASTAPITVSMWTAPGIKQAGVVGSLPVPGSVDSPGSSAQTLSKPKTHPVYAHRNEMSLRSLVYRSEVSSRLLRRTGISEVFTVTKNEREAHLLAENQESA
jgi:hypothetical protein